MSQALTAAAIVIATVIGMEGAAALLHRFWMHGPGWAWHRSHHDPACRRGFERNDAFGLVFAAIAVALAAVGHGAWWPLYWVSLGMMLYGLLYALLHDGLVHRRWLLPWPAPRQRYLRRLVQAHRLHHAVSERQGAVSFGFLYAPPVAGLAAQLRARRHGAAPAPMARGTQAAVGLGLALLLVAAWLLVLVWALFVQPWHGAAWLLAPFVVALMCWLDVGLFIVGHDAMHGSLVPGRRRLNDVFGQLCLALYGGFTLGRFAPRHAAHHRHPGSADDPDFRTETQRFWPWYRDFLRQYLRWREAAGLALWFVLLALVLRAPLLNVLLFWALPAMLSSAQLFAFGTWLPHRRAGRAFADAHRARSNAYGPALSLLTCFHFGYHHEHHLRPDLPWWRLPSLRRRLNASAGAASTGARVTP